MRPVDHDALRADLEAEAEERAAIRAGSNVTNIEEARARRSRATATDDASSRTEIGNARRIVARFGEDIRFVHAWKSWITWTGTTWQRDETGVLARHAKTISDALWAEVATVHESQREAVVRFARRSSSSGAVSAMLTLASTETEVAVTHTQLDADHFLLGVQNGTVDLRTGTLRAPRREDLITKAAGCAYDPNAEAPLWQAFLERVLPDPSLRDFLQKFLGYSLTGVVREHVLPILHGAGANGKSTLLETVRHVIGDYARTIPSEVLVVRRSEAKDTERAIFFGTRFALASETEVGAVLAESLVKSLVGGDTISARHLYGDPFDFRPTHKLVLATNARPNVRGTDEAIWRRLALVPFEVTIPAEERDPALGAKLLAESAGILRWLVDGCVAWQRDGLSIPKAVQDATAEYRAESDVIGAFLADCCEVDRRGTARASDVYTRFVKWCERSGEVSGSQTAFGARLVRGRGGQIERRKDRAGWFYSGVKLRGCDAQPADDGDFL